MNTPTPWDEFIAQMKAAQACPKLTNGKDTHDAWKCIQVEAAAVALLFAVRNEFITMPIETDKQIKTKQSAAQALLTFSKLVDDAVRSYLYEDKL